MYPCNWHTWHIKQFNPSDQHSELPQKEVRARDNKNKCRNSIRTIFALGLSNIILQAVLYVLYLRAYDHSCTDCLCQGVGRETSWSKCMTMLTTEAEIFQPRLIAPSFYMICKGFHFLLQVVHLLNLQFGVHQGISCTFDDLSHNPIMIGLQCW